MVLASASIYLFNDVVDAEADRNHPTKRTRPVASGELPAGLAIGAGVVSALLALAGALAMSTELAVTIAVYLAMQVSYVLGLKHQPVLDLAVVSSGFLLRAVAGGVAASVPLSQWFLIVAAFGSLYMVAGKRFSELHTVGADALTRRSLTMYSDPFARGLECTPFVATATSSERVSVFDNGMDIARVDWLRDGVINALAYPRAAAAEFDTTPAVPADNLLMTGGDKDLADMIAGTERGLLLTTLWYIRTVDPAVLLLTGLTRDGVYLIEDGEVTAAVNNFRFNESPLDVLRRATEAGVAEQTLPREWGDWATRAVMPTLRIPDFHMSSVSQAQ